MKDYLFITNLRFVLNGFILIYQDLLNNLKRDPTSDITSERHKKGLNLFSGLLQIFNFSILNVMRWILILRFIMIFHNIFNQYILNILGIFNIWQCHTHIFLSSISLKVYFPLLADLLDTYLFYYYLTAPPLFLFNDFSLTTVLGTFFFV